MSAPAIRPNRITTWKTQLLQRAKESFETAAERSERAGPSVKDMQAKVWQLALMRRIDELHLNLPFAGARMLRDLLRLEGRSVGRQRVARPMRLMGVEALYRKVNTSPRHPAHAVFPYLLRGQVIERPNHVWAMDITYIPMKRGFVYLAAVVDWATRCFLAWRLSISMDGKGCCRGNVFVERLGKSVKHEEAYLHAYESVTEAGQGLARYFTFYNAGRPHSSLDRQTPDTVYFKSLSALFAA